MVKYVCSSILVAVVLGCMPFVVEVEAQTSGAIALKLPMSELAPNGAVVCATQVGFELCREQASSRMFGVVTTTPVAAFEAIDESDEDSTYVVQAGRMLVQAIENDEPIQPGDLITSSGEPGVAMKASQNGYVLGTALTAFAPSGAGDGRGTVEVLLDIRLHSGISNARSNLIEVLRSGINAPVFEPLASFRYLLAALLIVLAFALGMTYFGRMARSGVEAIGRNPTASKMIQFQVLINSFVLVAAIGAGLFAAYLVLIL